MHLSPNDPMLNHKCRKIAQIAPPDDGREIWIGELLEPVLGAEIETHCLHITTPSKSVVFGVYPGDALYFAMVAQVIHGDSLNQQSINEWVEDAKTEAEAQHAQH